MSLLSGILLLFCAFLLLRLRAKRRLTRQLLESVQEGRPLLLEKRRGFWTGGLDELVDTVNRLVRENNTMTETGRDYVEQIRATLGNLREAVVMVDAENRIRLSNPVFSELVAAPQDPNGKRLDLYIEGESFHRFLATVRERGEGVREELKVNIGRQSRWLDVSAAPLPGQLTGRGVYTLFVIHDITRQKSLEKMRTEFVANVSHELKTPVTVIKGFAETLVEDERILSAEERLRFLKKIRANSERLHTLLEDLLLLSKLESTEGLVRRENLCLESFLEELVAHWGTVLLENGQRLILDCSVDADRVHADPLRLNQVLTNLLENVRRHAKGAREVHLRTRKAGQEIIITVEDDGAGIPEKDLPHIFERFYRVEKGRSRESGGTGLGLSIVKHIIAQHGGRIEGRSRKGEGTAIEIRLPYAK